MIQDPYDSELFRSTGHRLIDDLAEYLARARAGDMPVLPSIPPDDLLATVPGSFPSDAAEDPDGEILRILREVVASTNHVHHRGYVGHQIAVPVPAATLIEMVTALLNNGMAIYEMGQMHTVMERHVVDHNFPLDQAVAAPRIHQSFLPDRARFESKRPLHPALVAALKARGHQITGSHLAMGDSNDLLIEGALAYGVADPRGGGLAQAARPAPTP
jgi:hypothetical protein